MNYLSNKNILAVVNQWIERRKITPDEPLPADLAKMLKLMIDRIASKGNFSNYTYKDEMISEAWYNLVRYAKNFKPERSDNPFAYFTQIIKNSFIHVIKHEKQEATLKKELLLLQICHEGLSVDAINKADYNNQGL